MTGAILIFGLRLLYLVLQIIYTFLQNEKTRLAAENVKQKIVSAKSGVSAMSDNAVDSELRQQFGRKD